MRVTLTTLHSKYIHASLALPCLAAYCSDLPCTFTISECTVHEPKETLLALLLADAPEVVAFSVYLWNRRETLELIDALAVARPDLRIVLGGPEVSFEGPELFRSHPGISALVRGEGELPFHGLLKAWCAGDEPRFVPRLAWRHGKQVEEGPDAPPLADLDAVPSPFAAGWVDLTRGFTYYESSRGCPYRCSFCMSARDPKVRSFSMERIKQDLQRLMEHKVAKIKLVDRTFNYDATRAREIFSFILKHNRGSHFHFEIGAHLLDDETLELLATVPEGMFQFEIGVQSTLDETLTAIERRIDLEHLEQNVAKLRERTRIHLHLDLIAGLPGENQAQVLCAVDRVMDLKPHHLQLEPVKLLPGSLLRESADRLGVRFDPNPPYTVLATSDLSYPELNELRTFSRLLDVTWNHGRMHGFLAALAHSCGSFATGLALIARQLDRSGELRHPLSQRGLFETLARTLVAIFADPSRQILLEQLARDYARSERVPANDPPDFYDTSLDTGEQQRVRRRLAVELEALRGQGVRLQHFTCLFHHPTRHPVLFLYLTRQGTPLEVREIVP